MISLQAFLAYPGLHYYYYYYRPLSADQRCADADGCVRGRDARECGHGRDF